jgi:hypothetical protein
MCLHKNICYGQRYPSFLSSSQKYSCFLCNYHNTELLGLQRENKTKFKKIKFIHVIEIKRLGIRFRMKHKNSTAIH